MKKQYKNMTGEELKNYLTNELAKRKKYRASVYKDMKTDDKRIVSFLMSEDTAVNDILEKLRKVL